MFLFFVYLELKLRGYNFFNGFIDGIDFVYIKKGWMDRVMFFKFIDYFDWYVGVECLVLFFFDSVSSYVDYDVLMKVKLKGIELYWIFFNVIYLM